MRNSHIEWTDHTVNFWWGCTKVSPACKNCYAESVAKVFGKPLFGSVPEWGAGKPRQPRLEAARKEALALNRKAQKAGTRYKVFVNSMSDWLDEEVPIEWLAYLLETLFMCPNLDFQLLTKRPENFWPRVGSIRQNEEACSKPFHGWLMGWFLGKAPSNIWIGITLEEPNVKRLEDLLAIPALVRFLSCEPLLSELDFYAMSAEMKPETHPWRNAPILHGIHWVITGGESGSKARPSHPDWFRSLRDQCLRAGVPFFFKQWGEWIPAGSESKHLPQEKTYKAEWLPAEGPTRTLMLRGGVKHTGRLLLGQEWSCFPSPLSAELQHAA